MAKTLSEKTITGKSVTIRVGKQIVDILTTGMYSDPLMVLREYIQNSVDSIDKAVATGLIAYNEGLVTVTHDGAERKLQVEDNGIGVRNDDVQATLCSLGYSEKDGTRCRGFRGIGRLGGIGYCDHLRFETRSKRREQVATVDWDCSSLRRMLAQKAQTPITEALRRVVAITYRKARSGDPKHFMRITLSGVRPFHRDKLMNPPAVASYLGQVAPVPFDGESFHAGGDIHEHLQEVSGYRTYNILLNGAPVRRPHTTRFDVSAGQSDQIRGIELFELSGHDGQSIGRGWYADTSCLASIPPRVGMRGIRVRQGNIEVGDERFLEGSFSEPRFATWHVGEIHLDYCVKTNARRDGFEQSPEYEAFLEQAASLGKHLSQVCRSASKRRSGRGSVQRAFQQLRYALAQKVCVDDDHAQLLVSEAESAFKRLQSMRKTGLLDAHQGKEVERCRKRLDRMQRRQCLLRDAVDGRKIRHLSQVDILEALAKSILKNGNHGQANKQLLPAVLDPYLKLRYRSVTKGNSARRRGQGAKSTE